MRQEDQISAAVLQNPDSIGSAILIILMDRFGTALFEWEPDTLRMEIQSNFGVTPPQENMDKIWALITALTTNLFYVSMEAFIHICNALGSEGADFQNYDPATVAEMCWGITEATLVYPPEKEDTFSQEILTYMRAQLAAEGFTSVPKLLKPYVGEEILDRSQVEDVITMDETDASAFWKNQQLKLADTDAYVRENLQRLVDTIIALPLRNSDPEGIEELRARASKALGAQAQQTKQERELLPARPFS